MNRATIMTLIALAACVAAVGCSDPKASNQPPPISQKTRVENLKPRIEKTHRLSETETVTVLLVPGFPFGERCIVYSNGTSSTMQCREVLPNHQ